MSTAQPDGEAIYQAFIEFVSSADWARSFAVLEARRDLLLPLGARLLLIRFLAEPDDKELRQRFALHLTLLEIAAADGIAAARTLVDEALRAGGQQGPSASHAEMHDTIVTSSGYAVPAGGPSPAASRPPSSGGGGNDNLEEILRRLPPEEREQVTRTLGLAQGGSQ